MYAVNDKEEHVGTFGSTSEDFRTPWENETSEINKKCKGSILHASGDIKVNIDTAFLLHTES